MSNFLPPGLTYDPSRHRRRKLSTGKLGNDGVKDEVKTADDESRRSEFEEVLSPQPRRPSSATRDLKASERSFDSQNLQDALADHSLPDEVFRGRRESLESHEPMLRSRSGQGRKASRERRTLSPHSQNLDMPIRTDERSILSFSHYVHPDRSSLRSPAPTDFTRTPFQRPESAHRNVSLLTTTLVSHSYPTVIPTPPSPVPDSDETDMSWPPSSTDDELAWNDIIKPRSLPVPPYLAPELSEDDAGLDSPLISLISPRSVPMNSSRSPSTSRSLHLPRPHSTSPSSPPTRGATRRRRGVRSTTSTIKRQASEPELSPTQSADHTFLELLENLKTFVGAFGSVPPSNLRTLTGVTTANALNASARPSILSPVVNVLTLKRSISEAEEPNRSSPSIATTDIPSSFVKSDTNSGMEDELTNLEKDQGQDTTIPSLGWFSWLNYRFNLPAWSLIGLGGLLVGVTHYFVRL